MTDFFSTEKRTALEAQAMAQWIAFGPVIFQVARALRQTGILEEIDRSKKEGCTREEIAQAVQLPCYGVRVLLESALGIGLVKEISGRYHMTKTGYFILHDELAAVNMNFIHDVCYRGLFHLEEAVRTGKPAGLRELGPWSTVYEGLSQLPPPLQKSWFEFDHYFSDRAFPDVLPQVYGSGRVKKLLDIGGNTGKWAIACCQYNPKVQITIVDLPGQLKFAKEKILQQGLDARVFFHEMNLLAQDQPLPKGYDTIWMSQFLDCFSEAEICSILHRCYAALDPGGEVLILEGFWDRQRFETAAFCLQQTSIYFTAIANGNSQMYDSRVFIPCIEKSGFRILEQVDQLGLSHTLLRCVKD